MNNRNTFKITSLHIRNFKSISEASFKFDENNLIIFGGPNGYGKTTAFEAIEVILAKTPRKYREIALDKRTSFLNSPIHKDENLPIHLTLTLNNNLQESICIKRYFEKSIQKESVNNNIRKIFESSKLFINEISATEAELENILDFQNVNTLFNVLHYVEQDENTFFLKKDPKDRYKEISCLLGAENELLKLEKIKSFEKKLSDLIKHKIEEKQKIITQNEKVLNSQTSDITYKKLILNKDFIWDQEKISNNDIDVRNNYLMEVERIKNLYSYRENLIDIYSFYTIQKYLNDEFLNNLIDYYWKIENHENLGKEYKIRIDIEKQFKANQILIDFIDKFAYDEFKKESIINYLKNKDCEVDMDSFSTRINLLLIQRDALGEQNKILENLKNKRTELISIQNQHAKFINLTESECPTCGFDWNSSEKLINQIQQTETKIFSEYNAANEKFESLKKEINEILFLIKSSLIAKNESIKLKLEGLITQNEFNELSTLYVQVKQKIDSFLNLLIEEDRISIINMINNKVIQNKEDIITNIKNIIGNKNLDIEFGLDIQQLISDYKLYFENDIEAVHNLSPDQIDSKLLYINTQYYLAINNNLNRLNEKIESLQTFKAKVESLKEIFDQKIKEYTKNIVDTVTIPFYIFTGKILQHHSLGLGLVLD